MNKCKLMTSELITDFLYRELSNFLETKEKMPCIVNITIGEEFANKVYSRMKDKVITFRTSIKYVSVHFEKITYEELINYIKELNLDDEVNGIMLQLPLPDYLKEYKEDILSVYIGDGITKIGENAFENCHNLGDVRFGNDIKSIGGQAFLSTSITEVVLPEGLEQISGWTFNFCLNLEKVVLPNSLRIYTAGHLYNQAISCYDESTTGERSRLSDTEKTQADKSIRRIVV